MADWSGIKHAINSTLGTTGFKPFNGLMTDVQTALSNTINNTSSTLSSSLNSISNLIGAGNPSSASTSTLMGYLKRISDTPRVIKSAQNGVAKGTRSGDLSIAISAVDITKSIVILDNSLMSISPNAAMSSTSVSGVILKDLSSNYITVTPPEQYTYYGSHSYSYTNFSWQLIEFY